MGGPPIILFLNYRSLPKEIFRATISSYVVLVCPINLALLIIFGAVNIYIFLLAITLIPFVLLGNTLGLRLFSLIPQKIFQKVVPLLVLVTALYSIITTLF